MIYVKTLIYLCINASRYFLMTARAYKNFGISQGFHLYFQGPAMDSILKIGNAVKLNIALLSMVTVMG